MRIKNWKEFQHYDTNKRSAPPWIRLYRTILDDHEWAQLDSEAAKVLIMLWLMASERDGRIPTSSMKIAFRLRTTEARINKALPLLLHWIECPASDVLASCYQDACLEQSRCRADTDADDKHPRTVIAKKRYLDFIDLTPEEHAALVAKLNGGTDAYIARLNDYIGSTGKKYRSHYHTILNWWRKDGEPSGVVPAPYTPAPAPKCAKCGTRAAYRNGVCAPCQEVRP